MKINSKPPYFPTLLFLLLLLAWGIFSSLPLAWTGWAPATCLGAGGCFCESIHPGALAQPVNSWSSLAFWLPGLIILFQPNPTLTRFGTLSRFHSVIFGSALLVIGLGSAFYHASLSFVGQFFDVQGMYLLLSFALLYALARLCDWGSRVFVALYLAANLALAAVLIWLPGIRREVFAGLVLATLGLEGWHIWAQRAWRGGRLFGAALGSLAVAYGFWILDNQRILCSPQSWLQGHALWHVLGALAAWFLFLYYQPEKISVIHP